MISIGEVETGRRGREVAEVLNTFGPSFEMIPVPMEAMILASDGEPPVGIELGIEVEVPFAEVPFAEVLATTEEVVAIVIVTVEPLAETVVLEWVLACAGTGRASVRCLHWFGREGPIGPKTCANCASTSGRTYQLFRGAPSRRS